MRTTHDAAIAKGNLIVRAQAPGQVLQSEHTGANAKRNAWESCKDFAREGATFVEVLDLNADHACLWSASKGTEKWARLG